MRVANASSAKGNEMTTQGRQRIIVAIFISTFLLLIGSVAAQDPIAIAINENKVGQLTSTQSAAIFTLTVDSAQIVVIQSLSVTTGLAVSFDVVSPAGVVIGNAINDGSQALVNARVSLPTAGTYFIRVNAANTITGQFLVSVQSAGQLLPPEPLTPGQPVNGQVGGDVVRRAYSFQLGGAESFFIYALNSGQPNGSSPIVTLKDAITQEILALTSARLSGIRYRVPASSVSTGYVLEISFGGTGAPQNYTVCVGTESATAPCNVDNGAVFAPAPTTGVTLLQVIPGPTATLAVVQIPADAACQVTSLQGTPVNVRQGPGLNFGIVSSLASNTTALVIGRLPDTSWYQVNNRGLLGWVSTTVIRVGGACSGVPIVQPPTGIPFTFTPASNATATPTLSFTNTPTATLSAPTAAPTLNFSLPPNFGSTALVSGFVPDPFTRGMTSGGSVNVSYLGGGCSGFATSAPDFSVNYTSGSFSLLRFYFVGSGDTTMIINGPGASFFCTDDSFGTLNPTIDFNSPSSGRYDIWIGSFASDNAISGTLNVTENSGNHP